MHIAEKCWLFHLTPVSFCPSSPSNPFLNPNPGQCCGQFRRRYNYVTMLTSPCPLTSSQFIAPTHWPFPTNHDLGFIHIYSHASVLHEILPLIEPFNQIFFSLSYHNQIICIQQLPWLGNSEFSR